nr:unnamed protein product [Callosobruchus analis]
MDDTDDGSPPTTEKFVYLDFNGKIDDDVLNKEFFFSMANLHKQNPLVQVNDYLFKGTYDYAMGTNIFLDTEENTEKGDAFCKKPPIKATVFLKQNKVLLLKPVKVCPKKIEITPEVKNLTFSFKWDYKTLLDKLEDGTLRLHETILTTEAEPDKKPGRCESANKTKTKDHNEREAGEVKEIQVQQEEEPKRHKVTAMEVTDIPDKQRKKEFQNKRQVQKLEAEYEKLKVLAWRPTRRIAEDELIEECDSKFQSSYEFQNIERQILKPCDAFKTEPVSNIDEETLSNCVDIDRCVLYSILSPSSDFPRILSPEERKKVLRLDNFDNLSLSARYCVIKEEVELLEKSIDTLPDHELTAKDEFGRTPKETLEIYRKLEQTLKRRIEEIKFSNLN